MHRPAHFEYCIGCTKSVRVATFSALKVWGVYYVTNPNAWVDEHGDMLYRYALSRLYSPVSVEDTEK